MHFLSKYSEIKKYIYFGYLKKKIRIFTQGFLYDQLKTF